MSSGQNDRLLGLVGNLGIKVPCRVASTAALTLTGEQTIDGIACVTGDRVLVKNQASGINNGIYTVDTGDWERAKDCDGTYDLVTGSLIKVNFGTAAQGFWYCSTTGDIVVGTTSIAFSAASTILASISTFWQTVIDDLTSNASLTTLTTTRSETGSVAVTLLNKFREVYSVKDFGATGDGSTDDTAAIQAAHDQMGTNGGALFFPRPASAYAVNTVVISKQCNIYGTGMHSGGGLISSNSATANTLDITGSSVTVRDIAFTSTPTRTGGAYIRCNSASSKVTLENIYMVGWKTGITLAGVSDFTLRRIVLSNGIATTGIGINVTSGLAINMTDVLEDNTAGQEPLAGLNVAACGDITMVGCHFIHNIDAMRVIPGAAQTATSINAVACYFDNSTTRALIIAPQSVTGTVQRCRFDGCWFGNSTTGSGVVIDTNSVAGTVDGITFIDPECVINGANGMDFSGANTKRIKVLGGKIAQNAAAGILIENGADNIQLIGVTSGAIDGLTGNATYGIRNDAGVTDDLIIASCQLTGNTTAAWLGGATGARRIASNNNGLVTENNGTSAIANGTTSIAVAHGLSVTPDASCIFIDPSANTTTDPGNLWVDTIGATNFTVNCRTNPGVSTMAFGWRARQPTI